MTEETLSPGVVAFLYVLMFFHWTVTYGLYVYGSIVGAAISGVFPLVFVGVLFLVDHASSMNVEEA